MLLEIPRNHLVSIAYLRHSGSPVILGSLSKLTRRRSTGTSPFKFRVKAVKGRLNSLGLESFRIGWPPTRQFA